MAVLAEPNPLTQLSEPDLRRRSSMKWRTHPADVLPLWVAEMDAPLAEPVAQVLRDAVAAGDTGYPFGTGYAEAVVGFADARWGTHGFDARRSALVPDVMLGIVEILRLVSEPGDAVVVCPPVYPPFYAFLTHADRRVVEAPLTAAGRLDPAAVDDALGAAGASSPHPVVLLANPHNPTGTAHSPVELAAVAAVANRRGARVVVDEIHAPLALPGASFVPYLSVPGSAGAFSLVSASKGWNLAGLKAALVFAGPDAAADLARMPEEVGHGASHLGVLAHTAAFRDSGRWLDALLVGLDENRALLAHRLPALLPQLGYLPPQATYLAWLDCRSLGRHDDEAEPDPAAPGVVTDLAGPARFFLDEARVALSSGHVFGHGGTGHVRLNFATSPELLDNALERMSAAVSRAERASP